MYRVPENGLSSSLQPFSVEAGTLKTGSTLALAAAGRLGHIAEFSPKHKWFSGMIHHINRKWYHILPEVNSWVAEKVKNIRHRQILSLTQMCGDEGGRGVAS